MCLASDVSSDLVRIDLGMNANKSKIALKKTKKLKNLTPLPKRLLFGTPLLVLF